MSRVNFIMRDLLCLNIFDVCTSFFPSFSSFNFAISSSSFLMHLENVPFDDWAQRLLLLLLMPSEQCSVSRGIHIFFCRWWMIMQANGTQIANAQFSSFVEMHKYKRRCLMERNNNGKVHHSTKSLLNSKMNVSKGIFGGISRRFGQKN